MRMYRPYLSNPTTYLHRTHSFFLNDFSTKVTVSGTQSTGQEMPKRPFDARQTLPRELTEGSHPISVANYAKQTRSNLTIHAQLSTPPLQKETHEPFSSSEQPNMSPQDGHQHERVQKQRQFARLHQPMQLARDTSSGSSTQNSSEGKVGEGELLLPVYSFMEYKDVPAVVYTKSETEANSLAHTLKG
jgi:hypothetical protein